MSDVPPSPTPDVDALRNMYVTGYNDAWREAIHARVRLGEERAALDRARADLQNRIDLHNARRRELGLLDLDSPLFEPAPRLTWEEAVARRRAIMDESARRHHAERGTTEWTGHQHQARRAA